MEEVLEMSVDSKALAVNLTAQHAEIVSQTEIQLKYEGYISREEDVAKKMSRLEEVKIPTDLDYSKMASLSSESKEKLSSLKPATIGQASRVSGVTPSDVSVLLVYLGR
jgi:tRNA uridine 5-carboxymethylaminomethyl modification enzyme